LLHEDGRERKNVADGVEAISGIVLREVFGGVYVDGQKVANGVVVFGAIEAARGDAARLGFEGFIGAVEFGLNPGGDGFEIVGIGPGKTFGGHFTGLETAKDGLPFLAVLRDRLGGCIGLEI
jgi:hypothetical protein